MATPEDGDGLVVLDAELLDRATKLLAKHPEKAAHQSIQEVRFDGAMFGTVPGAGTAVSRASGWVERTAAEYARVEVEVADLAAATGQARDTAIAGNDAATAAARLGTPR